MGTTAQAIFDGELILALVKYRLGEVSLPDTKDKIKQLTQELMENNND